MKINVTEIKTSESLKARANVAEKIEFEIESLTDRIDSINTTISEFTEDDDWRMKNYMEELTIKREELEIFKSLLPKI